MKVRKSILQRLDEPSIPWSVVVRIALGAYFIAVGINKVQDPFAFMKAIRLYGMLPDVPGIYLNSTTVILPWLEIICGAALVLGLFRRGAGAIIVLLLCVFTPAIFLRALEVMREESLSFFAIEFDCGCGGGPEIIWIKLLKNTGFFLAAVLCVASRSSALSLSGLIERFRGNKSRTAVESEPVDPSKKDDVPALIAGATDSAS